MPTLGIRKNVTYYFKQHDLTNYLHPLGFAYFPDGAHDEKEELETGIVPPGSSSTCDETLTCPAPMYMLNGEYLGANSNHAMMADVTGDEEDMGMDAYVPLFSLQPEGWRETGNFSIALKFDVEDFVDDLFYFCHVSSMKEVSSLVIL